jgi:hypothetical protein
MPDSTPLILAVGGVVLLTWYGIRQARVERSQRLPLPARGTEQYQHLAESALSGEFRLTPLSESFPGGTVLCPHCGIEFPAGTAYCDCGTETVEADEVEEPECPEPLAECEDLPDDALVCIHVGGSQWKASLLRSYLESHGIACVVRGPVANAFSHLQLPGNDEVRLFVPSEEAARARALLLDCN